MSGCGHYRRPVTRSNGWRRWSIFELFRAELEIALARADRSRGGRPPYDAVLMLRILVLQTLYTLSDDQTEYQSRDRLSFMRFAGLALHDVVPDAKTIWLFGEQLTRAGALERLFAQFDRLLHDRGYLAMGGQIVDATVIEAHRPRLTTDEKRTLRDGGTPSGWTKARTRQIDRDGRWTIKRGRKMPPTEPAQRQAVEIAVPVFGYKNHVGIDRTHGFIRRFTVTHAARPDGTQLAAVLDPANTASPVWADTAYRSRANLVLLQKRGLVAQFQRARPRGRPMPPHIARGKCRAGACARPHRARVCRREAEDGPGGPHHRPRARDRQDHAGQSRLQPASVRLDRGETCAGLMRKRRIDCPATRDRGLPHAPSSQTRPKIAPTVPSRRLFEVSNWPGGEQPEKGGVPQFVFTAIIFRPNRVAGANRSL